MRKAGFLAVSLVSLMTAGVANAAITSKTYVDDIASTKQDKLTIDTIATYEAIPAGEKEKHVPSVALAEDIASAVADAAVYATKEQLKNEYATKTQFAELESEYKAADAAIKATIGNVDPGKTVVEMITSAVSESAYDDTALAGRVKTIEDSAVMSSGATKAKIDAIGTNTTSITALQTGKQDKLTTENIKGEGSVSVTVANGVVTVNGTDTKYTLPAATANALGGVKSGGNITVANDGAVTVNQAASATKATQDASGNVITTTYATKTELTGVQTTANTAVTNAAAAQTRADSAYTLAGNMIPKPSGTCKDCVLKYNGTVFSWEEIGR